MSRLRSSLLPARFPLSAFFALPALTVCLAQPCIAAQNDPSPNPFDEIVVTASRVPQPLRSVGTSLSVLGHTELKLRGNLAVQELLRQTPAVSVTSAGGTGQTAGLRIRGEEGYRTLVILDGIRLLDPSGPQIGPQFEHILSSGLERVEILRGPQGLGYGADAGGVVNMTSLAPTREFNASLDTQAGSFGTRQYSGTLSGGAERADFALLFTDMSTDGFNAQTADTVLRDNDGYTNTTLHGRAGIDLADSLRLDLTHREVSGDAAFDGCFHPVTFAPEYACSNRYELDASRAALNYRGAGGTHTLAYATTGTDRDSRALDQSAFTFDGSLDRWEYLGYLPDLPGLALVFGADYEEARNNGVGRDNTGAFVELLSDFSSAMHLGLGVRNDDNDNFGSNTSYRLSGAWLVAVPNATLKFKGSYGTGFRAPSPYEIAYNGGAWSYPPASTTSLRQETSEGFEGGVEYLHDRGLHLDAVYFDQDVIDAIYFDLSTYSGYLQYSGSSTSRGVELSGDLPLAEHWRLQANYTWNDTEQPNGQQRPRRPQRQFNVGASFTALDDRLALSAFYRAARDAVDETPAGSVPLDDFGVLDLSANFRVAARVELYGRVENLLGERYEELTGYNSAERAVYAGFRLNYR
jgi:vitamin B12 transporter